LPCMCTRSRPVEFDSGDTSLRESNTHPGRLVDPYTNHLVIADRRHIPSNVFDRVNFVSPFVGLRANGLVEDFRYGTETGDIHYETQGTSGHSDDAYARLVTLNWWYKALLISISKAIVTCVSHFADLTYCFNLWSSKYAEHVSDMVKVFLLLFVVLTELWSIGTAACATNREWSIKADPTVLGDLVVNGGLSRWERWHVWSAMCVFNYICMDNFVRDMVIWLHPWKSVQPYGAMKCEGHRSYLIGFGSSHMFHCDRLAGQHRFLPKQIAIVGALIAMKVGLAWKLRYDFFSWALCLPSLVSCAVKLRSYLRLVRERECHWLWLNERWIHLDGERRVAPTFCEDQDNERRRPGDEDISQARRRWAEAANEDQIAATVGREQKLRVLEKQRTLHFSHLSWGERYDGWLFALRWIVFLCALDSFFLALVSSTAYVAT